MLAILPKLVYILTLGPFQTHQAGFGKIYLDDGVEDNFNLPASSRQSQIHGRARRSSIVRVANGTTSLTPGFVAGSGNNTDDIEKGELSPLRPPKGVKEAPENQGEIQIDGQAAATILEFIIDSIFIVAAVPLFVLAGIFYLLAQDGSLRSIFGFSTAAFAITIASGIGMFTLDQDSPWISTFFWISTAGIALGMITLISGILGDTFDMIFSSRVENKPNKQIKIHGQAANNYYQRFAPPHFKK